MDLQLAGRIVIITGGASGIGRATAEHFRREGARLVLADLQPAALATAVAELRTAGGEVESEAVDVRDYAACERLVTRTVDVFGRVDVLVNSAGIGGVPMLFAETTPRDWQDLVAINLVGVMNCCRAVTEHMIAQRSGRIVNLASEPTRWSASGPACTRSAASAASTTSRR